MIYQKDQCSPWVLLESPNFLISSRFTLGAVSHYNRMRTRLSSSICTGSEAVYLCWEAGWVEINKECLCQYLCEQSSWHLAVNWGGDFGLSEVEKYEPLLVCGSLVFPGAVLHCFCYESSLAQAQA